MVASPLPTGRQADPLQKRGSSSSTSKVEMFLEVFGNSILNIGYWTFNKYPIMNIE
jgi:hypothetical protein